LWERTQELDVFSCDRESIRSNILLISGLVRRQDLGDKVPNNEFAIHQLSHHTCALSDRRILPADHVLNILSVLSSVLPNELLEQSQAGILSAEVHPEDGPI